MTKFSLQSTLSPEIQEKLEKMAQMPEKSPVPQDEVSPTSSSIKPGISKGGISPKEKMDREQSRKRLQETKGWLENTWPKAFNFKNPVPLKLSIYKDIKALESPISYRQRLKALNGYIYSSGYLKAVLEGEWRHDLDGQPVEQISQEQKSYAQEQLQYRKAIWEQKKKEQRRQRRPKEEGAGS